VDRQLSQGAARPADATAEAAPIGRVLLVDAANVVGSRPTGWWRDRVGAARQLLAELQAALAEGRLTDPTVVVLEGAARAAQGTSDPAGGGVPAGPVDRVAGATLWVVSAPGSGDDLLVRLTSVACRQGFAELVDALVSFGGRPCSTPRPGRSERPASEDRRGLAVVVVTADRGLRARVLAAGGEVCGPGWLLRQLASSPGP
jgi:hypothetical protein